MTLTLEERETIIRRSMVDKQWDVFTEDPAFRRKMAKLGIPPTEEGEGFYRIPLACVSVRPPRPKRELTPAQATVLARVQEANAKRRAGGQS